jgi:uncharacterized protein GlcG (DUF336 family)
MESISLQDARGVIAGAEAKAQEIGQPMNIAVVDDGGNLRAHVRMDGAFIGSIGISINKAYTAIAFQTQTKDLVDVTQSGQPLFGLSDSAGGRIVIFAGGIPLVRDGRIVGAVGVSTGTVEQDQQVAEAGAGAF